ncbi:MAG: M48 family metallopeptidase [Candidatus Saccharimonadales bacterium]
MRSKQFILDEQITLTVAKRSSSRRIKLSIGHDGIVRASIPSWLPYSEAVKFAQSKIKWIKSKQPSPTLLTNGRPIGKNHTLIFKPTDKQSITTRLNQLEAVVFYPRYMVITDTVVQTAAKKLIKRALLSQSKQLLPIRLSQLANKYGYHYNEVKIKSLKTRWGSCDNHKNITLNLYLMELPWELIDYVLLHELNHTVIMQHGPKFWNQLKLNSPNYLELKKQLKTYPTLV